ncbi:MAG: peptidase S8 [Actinomycetota bacterium]
MRRVLVRSCVVLALLPLAALSWEPAAGAVNAHANYRAVCGPASGAQARCGALVVTDSQGNPLATRGPSGYGPDQFHGAYSLPTAAPAPQTIGIVDAYDWPTAKADLDKYDVQFGLPAFPSCSSTITTACFQKVNQDGLASPLPPANASWAQETAMDVEVAHAICQNCRILLVEANTAGFADLAAAENRAVLLGANTVSNSYGGGDWVIDLTPYQAAYDHQGVAIVASTGDNGYMSSGAVFPSSLPTVVAAGGTSLLVNADNSYRSESVWSGAGSGCSARFQAAAWQTSLGNWSAVGCGTARATADVAADADPATGAAVYDSTKYKSSVGWLTMGGTSLSSPIIAGVYALAANAVSQPYPASLAYANTSGLRDVTAGANSTTCGGRAICQAGAGYDGPTGLGTPNGTSSF